MYKKKNLIILAMCISVFIMIVVYAAFQTQLTITGSGTITSNWDIEIISVTSNPSGMAINMENPSYSKTNLTVKAGLYKPGDKMTYTITIMNRGSIDAIIDDVTATAEGSSVITYTIYGLQQDVKLEKGKSVTFSLVVEFDKDATSIPSNATKSINMNIICVQDDGQTLTPSDPTLDGVLVPPTPTYLSEHILYNNNGGTSDSGLDIDSTDGQGLYYTNERTENNQTTYYFRNSNNNYIKFGKNQCVFTGDKYDEFESMGWNMDVKLYNGNYVYNTVESYEDCMQDVYTHPFDPNFHVGFSSVDECTTFWRQVIVEAGGTLTDSDVCQVHKNATAWTTDLLWRIIRINEDGSVRIMIDNVDGLDGYTTKYLPYNSPFPGYIWNSSDNYGGQLGINLYSWYEYKELNLLSNSIVDSGFCINVDGETTTMTIEGYDENTPNILAMVNHIRSNPSFACPNSDDYLHTTSSSNKGNKLLEYPIGLITYDEVRYIKSSINNAEGLTLTPYYSTSDTEGQNLYGYWYLTDYTIDYQIPSNYYEGNNREGYAFPVINIRGDLEVAYNGTGTPGSSTNPYIVIAE